ncbi:RNase adapter RapZ [Parasulfuritortus cantonensis]|uniref:RNase adapter RapZ n=1 Tax=Parasulfuritortus cantonensis TaxID=2528202 RepID=A0A4R1BE78_9PROT|nr:RNase adapter RapZ [Parasulfuritortus cantonensis]TCJ15409.1 RNase adapter RapZ [Parasulfuritortus cantonensis]
MRLVVISGLSGSGKSVALKALEDAGYYCIDNLPADLLPAVVEHLRATECRELAVSIDARSATSLARLPADLGGLREALDLKVVFLETKDDTLVKRFSETRRRHPLSTGERSLTECIRDERNLLAPLRRLAHPLDTSDLSANSLRIWMREFCQIRSAAFTLVFQSFGFKHGIPLDADLVFDVRCLPNPHYQPDLRPLTGRDAPVVAFLRAQPAVLAMFEDIRAYLAKWLPAYIEDNRSYFTVALGCTGGQHRSVWFAETLVEHFRAGYPVLVRHRELP